MLAQPGRRSGSPSSVSATPAMTGELEQPRAVESLDASALIAAVEQHDRRHGVRVEPCRQLELVVELGNRPELQALRPARRSPRRLTGRGSGSARRAARARSSDGQQLVAYRDSRA